MIWGLWLMVLIAAPPAAEGESPAPAGESVPAPAEEAGRDERKRLEDRERDTVASVGEILREVWQAPPAKMKKLGNSILQRARRQNVSIADVQYAYAVTLAHGGDLTAAETNFRSVLERDRSQARVLLAMCHLNIFLERWPAALDDLRQLWGAHPNDPVVVATMARVLTFWRAKPPEKLRPRDLDELDAKVRGEISPGSRPVFDAAVAETEKFLADLPKLREELLVPADGLQEESVALRQKAEEMDRKLLPIRADIQRMVFEMDRIQAIGAADLAEVDRSIERARQRGDQIGVQSFLGQRQAVLARIDARARAAQLRQQELQLQLDQEVRQIQAVLMDASSKAEQAEQAVAEVDRYLNRPPATWTTIEEREKLLAGDLLVLAPRAKKSPPPKPNPPVEEKSAPPADPAKVWLSLADTCRLSGKQELARKYYEKVVAEFPESLAAEDARWQLDQMNADAPRSTNPSSKDRPTKNRRPRTKGEGGS